MFKSAFSFLVAVRRRSYAYPMADAFFICLTAASSRYAAARIWMTGALFLCLIAACGDATEHPREENGNTAVPFACLRYDSAQVEYRLDSIQNKGFILQPYLPDAADRARPYQLIAYVLDTLADYPNSWIPDTLRIVDDSLPRYFTGGIIVGNNEVTREQVEDIINDGQGNRISYDYLVFTPVIEGNFNHLTYRIRPVKGNTTATGNEGKIQMSSPQPPSKVW